ncbi:MULTISPECIES: hypothetical protein [Rhodococcus]|nr:hypothetical protein [Rhodococcus qingshengii]
MTKHIIDALRERIEFLSPLARTEYDHGTVDGLKEALTMLEQVHA